MEKVTRYSIKLLLFVVVAFSAASSVLAQGWPFPAKTQNTPVKCPALTPACSKGPDKLTAAYSDPIKTFTGRFLDSQSVKEYQNNPRRTLRARLSRIAPERNRIYMMHGATLIAYNLSTFFTRLESGEAMTSMFGRPGIPEQYLQWNAELYPESSLDWNAPFTDGQDRLFGLDYDDRGYVYPAYSTFGWGAVFDNPATGFETKFQAPPNSATGDVDAFNCLSVKSGGNYYLIASSPNTPRSTVWNMGTASTFAHDRIGTIASSIWIWAKAENGTRIGTVDYNGRVRIYTNDSMVTGSPLIQFDPTDGYQFTGIDTDGSNFYVVCTKFGANARLSVYTPHGVTYTVRNEELASNYIGPAGVRWGAGFLAIFGAESFGANLRLYKTATNGTVQELPTNSFFSKYYAQNPDPCIVANVNPPGCVALYVTPNSCGVFPIAPGADALPYKSGGKTYLIVSAVGLGDVYELKAGDTISPKVKTIGAGTNPNSLGTVGTNPYYGDKVTFTTTSSALVPPGVDWQFGDGGTGSSTSNSPDITYQYGGLTETTLPASRTVTATSQLDSAATDKLTVTLLKPTIRVGIKGRSDLLFLQPDISSSAPIVTSDEFIDGSDGALEGHFDEWKIDGTVTKTIPSASVPVGGCAAHELIYTAHYGPNNQSSFQMTSSEAKLEINSFKYNARPFTVDIAQPTAGPTDVTFAPVLRTTTKTSDLAQGTSTAATYLWELLNTNGTVNMTFPASGTPAAATLGGVPSFLVPRTKFGTGAMQVRLTIEVGGAAACGYQKQTKLMTGLAGPNATLAKTGCTNVGSPCTFSVTAPNALPSWNYEWSITGAAPFSLSGVGLSTYSPGFLLAGDYAVSVKVSNAIGSQTLTLVPNVHLDMPVCSSSPASGNTSIDYGGPINGSACIDLFTPCLPGETIKFRALASGWTKSDCDTYDWNFGDNTAHSTLAEPTHSYNSNGTYTVTLRLTGGLSSVEKTTQLKVGFAPVPTPPNPTPPNPTPPNPTPPNPTPPNPTPGGGCGTLQSDSAYLGYYGGTSGCTANSGNCNTNEQVGFEVHGTNGYSLGCTTHSFAWNFGDPTSSTNTSTGAAPLHAYATAGQYQASLTVGNGAASATFFIPVKVGSGSGVQCPPLGTQHLVMNYYSTNAACKPGGSCSANQGISFSVGLTGYPAGCDLRTFSWSFGDEESTSTLPTPTHTFKGPGDYSVSVTVTNGGSPVTVAVPVHVIDATSSCPALTANNVFFVWYGPNTNCTPNNLDCKDNESVGFSAYSKNGYSFSCGAHSFEWNFKDGSAIENGQSLSHEFTGPGIYDVTLTVRNPASSVVLTQRVRVANDQGVIPITGARRRPTKH